MCCTLGNELRNLTTSILETVAPPISEHELVEVFLSHDMIGYVGLEALVYRAFARVMEQTESGHVVVRKVGDKEDAQPESRNLNMCEGMLEGTKLAKVWIRKKKSKKKLEGSCSSTISNHR